MAEVEAAAGEEAQGGGGFWNGGAFTNMMMILLVVNLVKFNAAPPATGHASGPLETQEQLLELDDSQIRLRFEQREDQWMIEQKNTPNGLTRDQLRDLSAESKRAMLVQASVAAPAPKNKTVIAMKNLFGTFEDCELFVHLGEQKAVGSIDTVLNEQAAAAEGLSLVWRSAVKYEANANVTIELKLPPLTTEQLSSGLPELHLITHLLKTDLVTQFRRGELNSSTFPREHVINNSIPLIVHMRELFPDSKAENLFAQNTGLAEQTTKLAVNKSQKFPYFKSKIAIRPVYDHQVQNTNTLANGPFRRIINFPPLAVYQPYLYTSDFWLMEKDYVPLNETLEGVSLDLTVSYESISIFAWTMQKQMEDQWLEKGASEWSLTDTQRDSFMIKRLVLDTNVYVLGFSGAFMLLHTVFSLLAFKNDIQFWRKNESMQGLSARTMGVSFICQIITALYLLDSQDTSRMILFHILMDLALASWKFKKAIKISCSSKFPFVQFAGRDGYENNNTSKYDEEAVKYMGYALGPLFLCYSVYSVMYNKHRSLWSYIIGTLAGGVYLFGFIMMTPQLYINYKLKSVEHLPWRALTYKAMNTFVDDIAAFLIDMPMMHRLSCFRDDLIFFVYLYQRWKYRVDKSRPSMWVGDDGLTPSEREAKEKLNGAHQPAIAQQPSDMAEETTAAAGEVAAPAEEAPVPVLQDQQESTNEEAVAPTVGLRRRHGDKTSIVTE